MTHIESAAMAAPATFGRDGAMFESLLGFVGQLSVVLWGLVMLTVVIRFVGIRIYRRGAARAALVEAVAPSATVPNAAVPAPAGTATITEIDLVQPAARQLSGTVTDATFDEVQQPAEVPVAASVVAASVKVPRHGTRNRRAEPRSTAHVPALAANSVES
jgi:hypothetical protein